jgi:hypothetical protein
MLGRGRHVERARRSFDTLVIDKKVLRALGGEEAVVDILQALSPVDHGDPQETASRVAPPSDKSWKRS